MRVFVVNVLLNVSYKVELHYSSAALHCEDANFNSRNYCLFQAKTQATAAMEILHDQ